MKTYRGRRAPDGTMVAERSGPAPGRPTVGEVLPGYLADLAAAGRARHTVDSTRLDLLQLGRFLGRQPLADVSSDDLRGFFAWLGRQHGNRSSSLRRKTSTVKRFFRRLHESGLAAADPAAAVAYPPLAVAARAPLSAAEAETILAAAHAPPWRALVALLLDCGLKRDEAVALRRADLELEVSPPRLHVRHRATSQRARRRTLPLGDRLAATLRALPGGEADGAVLGLSARGVDFVVETCARRAGVRPGTKVTPQMLRDTYACRRVATRLELEAALADPAARAALERDHDRLLLRELGLADSSGAAGRYRRMV